MVCSGKKYTIYSVAIMTKKKNNNDVRISNTAVTMVTLQGESFTANNTLDEVSLLLLQWNDC